MQVLIDSAMCRPNNTSKLIEFSGKFAVKLLIIDPANRLAKNKEETMVVHFMHGVLCFDHPVLSIMRFICFYLVLTLYQIVHVFDKYGDFFHKQSSPDE